MPTAHEIPLGHSIPSHCVHGWCSHCPGRSLAEEVAAWQVAAMDRARQGALTHELSGVRERLLADENAPRLRAELAQARSAALTAAERRLLAHALDQVGEETLLGDDFTEDDRAALEKLRRMASEAQ